MQNVFSVIAAGLLSIASLEKGHLQKFASLQELLYFSLKIRKHPSHANSGRGSSLNISA